MPSLEEQPPFKVLIIGGSYSGLAATLNLVDLCHGRKCRFNLDENEQGPGNTIPVQVTIVDERDGFYHLIGLPLAIASNPDASTFWKKFDDITALQSPDINHIQGRVDSIDCKSRIARILQNTANDGHRIIEETYDYMIACSGLRREWPSAPKSLTREAYIAETADSVRTIEKAAEGVVVIGGGAVGIEIAAEMKMLRPQTKVTLVHSRQQLLSSEDLPDEFKDKTLEILRESKVEVVLGARVQDTVLDSDSSPAKYTLKLSDGRELIADHVINAVSRFAPTSSYLPKSACDAEGYVRITPNLQFSADVPNKECHYAAGDIASWSGIKRGGAAMHQAHFAAFNIHQQMLARRYNTEPKFVELVEVAPMMALALGRTAVGYFPAMGLSSGDEIRDMFFNDDLGYQICWKWMRLGEVTE
ncbi:FAD-dependent pyridine nucleotide-disulfide oxidoreductase [Penicillium griseofulvum]|uniref:FAD-dependent pyridine nucleotide-disulfide oxidoreductase n=1 Tax=Penicillium patulum TaxID=5078 RepID=A0A135LCR0_PENPA|nr:FAD-dependent pyridine nucleotide-disulfide oxidoreductase [Penicillium griseofulvum]KXG46756.1 FAD-dependent pyridine nucleotide-disulfide oxidoreductase [Penicillium griseofulvum]